jgi:hypothetical protein
MNVDAIVAALGGLGIGGIVFGVLLFIAPLAIWVHVARTASEVRKHTRILQRIAEAQEKIASGQVGAGR